jgi:hypothetical protein
MGQNEADRALAGPVDEKARAFLPDDLYPVAQQLASRLLARVAEAEEKDKLLERALSVIEHSKLTSCDCLAGEIRKSLGRT